MGSMPSSLSNLGATQKTLVALALREPKFVEQYREVLNPAYFDDPTLSHIMRAVLNYSAKYLKIPDADTSRALMQTYCSENRFDIDSSRSLLVTLDVLLETDLTNQQFVVDEAVKFAQYQGMKMAILEGAQLLNGDGGPDSFPKILKRVQDALSIGISRDYGLTLREGGPMLTDILAADAMFSDGRRVKTGLPRLDEVMNGGPGPGELGVVMAPSGKGKSMALVSFGAAAIRQGFNVIYYTLELSAPDVLLRFCSNLTHIPMNDISRNNDISTEYRRRIEAFAQQSNNLYIKKFPTRGITAAGLRSHLSYLISQTGVQPNLVLVDYADLLSSRARSFNSAEVSAATGELYEELRGMAEEFQTPIWTASQVRKESWNDSLIDTADVASSVGKINAADAVLTMSQTDQERAANKLRVYIAKLRRGQDGDIINCLLEKSMSVLRTDPDSLNVSTTGEVSSTPRPQSTRPTISSAPPSLGDVERLLGGS